MKKKIRDLWKLYRKYGIKALITWRQIYYSKTNPIKVNLPGLSTIFLRPNSSDIDAFFQVLVYEDFNIKMNRQPEFIVDLGANIGLFAIKVKALFPNVKVSCVEPDPHNFEILKLNTQELYGVQCYQKAIWPKQETLFINDDDVESWGKTVETHQSNPEAKVIETITIDKILEETQENEISILKVDIEGAEKELFEAEHKPWFQKVGILIIELHDRKKSGATRAVFEAVTKRSFYYPYQQENLIFKFTD